MAETKSAAQPVSVVQSAAPGSLLDTIVESGRLGQTKEEQSKGKEWVKELVDQAIAKLGENIAIRRFARFKVGEMDGSGSSGPTSE